MAKNVKLAASALSRAGSALVAPVAAPKTPTISGYFNSAGQPTFQPMVTQELSQVPAQAGIPAAAAQPGAPATGATTPAPAAYQPTTAPFLTPTQQADLTAWNTKYGNDIQSLSQKDIDAAATYNTNIHNYAETAAQNSDTTNQATAARGMFQSSIRDNDLNDIALTLTKQNNAAQTARDTTLFNDAIARSTENAQNTSEQTTYNADAIANAQGVTPSPTSPVPAPAPSNPAPTAGAAATPGGSAGVNPGIKTAGSALVGGGTSRLAAGLSSVGTALLGAPAITKAATTRANPGQIRAPGAGLGLFGNLLQGAKGKVGAPQ